MSNEQMTISDEGAGFVTRQGEQQLGHKAPRFLPRLNVKRVGAIFLTLIVLLIFFSRTIYEHNLPRVTAVRPQTGRLSNLEVSRGIAAHAEVENIFAVVTGTVEEVLVREGEVVEEGQELLRLSFDRADAERRLADLQNSRGRISNDIQNLNLQIERLNRQIEDLMRGEDISRHSLDMLSLDLRQAQSDLRFARDAYRDIRDYYDRDDPQRRQAWREVERAQTRVQSLQLQYEETARNIERQEEESERTRHTRFADLQGEIAALQNSVSSRNLDLAGINLQEDPYRRALEDFETYAVITAPTSGTVLALNVGRGELVRDNQLMAVVGVAGEFVVEATVSLDNNFIVPGDNAELTNMSHFITGTVLNITPTAQGKTVRVGFSSDAVAPGETFDVTFQKDGETAFTLVPNGALRQDNDGFFVNQIRRRDGIMGREYYLARLPVFIGDSDNRNTAIIQGITFFEPIAHISSRAVSPGDVVVLENESDFFES